jgi:methionyl-tRNA formyltransferase
MRVVFMGNDAWSVPSLEALASSRYTPVLVVTRVPRPAGRGNRLRPTAVAAAARLLGLPLREVETVRAGAGFEAVAAARPDVLAVVAYGEILPETVLALPAVAPVNVHFSLLPGLRGAGPVQRAILAGLPVTGVTTMRMDAGLDTGPVLLQAEETIREDDDAGSLGQRLAALGGRLLVETLDRLVAGTLEARAQEHERATSAPKLRAEDERIDWARPAEEIVRQVRALAPSPGAATRFRGMVLKVFRAGWSPLEGPPQVAGAIVAHRDGFLVQAGDAASVRLDQVALEGRKRISGEEFVHGYRPKPGERLD